MKAWSDVKAWPDSKTIVQGSPTSYPAHSLFKATKCSMKTSWDLLQDSAIAKDERDIVGDSTYAALFVYNDQTHAYFRIRLDDTPVVTAGGNKPLAQFGWGVGLDTNNNTANIEYYFVINGIKEVVNMTRASDGVVIATWQPTLDTSGTPFAPRWVHTMPTSDGSTFGSPADADYFITFAIPMAAAAKATANDTNPLVWGSLRLWAGTSSNGTTLTSDYMCFNDATGLVSLPGAVTDPVIISPLSIDFDGDGIPDGKEDKNGNGKVDPGETDPLKKDTDGDGLNDGIEDKDKDGIWDKGETDPLKKDTDGDGLDDGVEDKDKDGVVDTTETDPTKADTDNGCESDGSEVAAGRNPLNASDDKCSTQDTDKDGIPDVKEDKNGNGKVDAGETDPLKKDTDGDGMDDGVEDTNKNGQVDQGETDPTKQDSDGDGINDGVEDTNKNAKVDPGETDPTKWDTDGGGESDGSEVQAGRNPLDKSDDKP